MDLEISRPFRLGLGDRKRTQGSSAEAHPHVLSLVLRTCLQGGRFCCHPNLQVATLRSRKWERCDLCHPGRSEAETELGQGQGRAWRSPKWVS